MYFYHITENKDVNMLLKNGLSPYIGERARFIEEEPAIYLCKRKDLPYWKIILGKSTVLQISGLHIPEKERYQYHHYGEYVYYQDIKPEQIKKIYTQKPSEQHMKHLCESYLMVISSFTVRAAKIYTKEFYTKDIWLTQKENYDSYKGEFHDCLKTSVMTFQHLNYSIFSKEERRAMLKNLGESGEYTFLDTYLNTENRLYEQLIQYPEDETWETRKQLYEYIITVFQDCLDLDTGGWTG